ncbi:2Fe-2S iron-sulfur cluster-binding protein [Chachezhania sediminis]|uniref:2Fe-2S iron-sulfur cluster-binding protein n=1 Tax=Chachezhania sediminis TaxID=2599291 RepID=UPI00131C130F|nr:2Fe-2S iron-sulfur cluster-binding protein [Chachezhania sediminis]
MTGRRLGKGGLIDRGRPLSFRFDGREIQGFAGDTLASALVASGVGVVARSFKYHRPRGLWANWAEDPNALFDVALDGVTRPNVHGATTVLEDGMELRSVNAWPSVRRDLKAGLDLFHRFLPAGFYYKAFMWPDWHLFEPSIRRMAGMGRVEPGEPGTPALNRHDRCDLLVVGGGLAGLTAARAAAEAGQDVVLVEDHPVAGGALHGFGGTVDGLTGAEWAAAQIAAIRAAGGRVMCATTATGIYDHRLVTLVTAAPFAQAPRLCRMRADRIVLATGAVDRPLVFDGNDRPGVMSPFAALDLLGRQAVLVGSRIALLHPQPEPVAARLEAAGASVSIHDPAAERLRVKGRKAVTGLCVAGCRHGCDTILAAAGSTPLVNLWCHAGGKLDWVEASFVPGEGPEGLSVIGAARGTSDDDAIREEARQAALGAALPPRGRPASGLLPNPLRGRAWVDLQNDVTTDDIALAARENFTSVEHLKRYTTLGMGTDQGRNSNVNGLALMAQHLGRTVPEVGTTKFRPPYVPVPLELYGGTRTGALNHAPKRLVLEPQHRALDAALGEYGGWLRPAWYARTEHAGRADEAVAREVLRTRQVAGILDASPLGKIEVMGPDAGAFLNFVYYNTMATLEPGRVRYGFMLTERGAVYDDGVLARLGPDHFVVSCSSSHVVGVMQHLEAWRQDGHDPDRIHVHDATQAWATVTVTGPRARDIVSDLGVGVDLRACAFPHMAIREGRFRSAPARVSRVSFTGELSFEISVPLDRARILWSAALAVGAPMGSGPLGMEALSILRAEKGFVIIGQDTTGDTMPHDLGFAGPRDRKTEPYVGDHGLQMEVARDPDRLQLVGLQVLDHAPKLARGAHLVRGAASGRPVSEGYVTSSYDSPTLLRPIALALLARGHTRMGEAVTVWHMGELRTARVVPACAIDPEGGRMNA